MKILNFFMDFFFTAFFVAKYLELYLVTNNSHFYKIVFNSLINFLSLIK